ncbi:hypothetical protein BDDG_12168 [Blastomyces dermatitidis ATCC 18188]|uniref:Uncharacterized protein n=1 Tax=Ajellomyces dermatitidis (strain ATCC 18188 / CBS 674.68) TaxID=653446 RepID=A0A0J9EN89_AJEDA|nr:hypothetical protein BDFG_02717 [Blastomyces dermatitidis ATCC 26199]KMW67531.1 hypothetical protein BDDG_12168 [Blastomyces dermatitidis ATCC 18188]
MKKGIEHATPWEDYPETLASHHREYNDFMQQYLALQGNSGPSHTAVAAAFQGSSVTHKSLFVENLLISVNSLEPPENKYETIEMYDLLYDLAEGEVDDFLRKALRLLWIKV